MKGKDQIEQLFSDKLGNFEAKVDPSLWSGVSSQLGAQAAGSTAAGMSLVTKAIIGISAASVIAVSAIIFMDNDKNPSNTVIAKTEEAVKPLEKIDEVSIINEMKESNSNPIIIPEINTLEEETLLETIPEEAGLLSDLDIFDETTPELTNEIPEAVVETIIVEEELDILPVFEEEVVVEAEEIELYTIENLPNIFTPNGDGNNDVFSINTSGLSDFSITILNTQNQVVFKSNDAKFEWSGLDFSQNQVAEGNYVYYLTARDSAGNPVNKYSQLVIRR